jgi:hypothetical protein
VGALSFIVAYGFAAFYAEVGEAHAAFQISNIR